MFNLADGAGESYAAPWKGKVLIYQSPQDPKTNKADLSITCEVTPRLKPILKTLPRRFSPVSSK